MNRTVVIAGAGPTGLMLACELGLAGVPAVVLESLAEPDRQSPSMAINASSVELLDQRGLMDELRKDSLAFPAAHFSLLWLDATKLSDEHENSVIVDQARVEELLRKRAAELGADIRLGHQVVSVGQDENGVVVGARSTNGEYEISGQYLVGCDGADSAVRKLAGIGFPGTDPAFYGIVGDVKIDMSDLVEGQIGAFYYPSGGIYAGGPVTPGTLRVVTAEFDVEAPLSGSVTLDELRTQLRRLTGTEFKITEVGWLARYRIATRHAERYRTGRVFLAGDAAHTFFPLGGLRLNACIEDAVNLGWKLAADIQGWASPDLLDTYQGERYPVGQRLGKATIAQVALMQTSVGVAELRELFHEFLRFEDVNQHLLELVTGLDVRYPMPYQDQSAGAEAPPLLGCRLGQVALKTAAGEDSSARIMHAGRGVLLDLSCGVTNLADVAGWADRIDVVTAEPTPAIEAAALLIRPDGHVAWADPKGTDAESLRTALRTWFGEPAGARGDG